jgi:hypothetical protein
MRDFPNTKNALWVLLGVVFTTILVSLGDNMSAIVPLVVISVGGIVILFVVDVFNVYNRSWKKVQFVEWNKAFTHNIWGGVKVENDTWADLENCKAERIITWVMLR